MAGLKDLYVNYCVIKSTTGADARTLSEGVKGTDAGFASKIAWEIHKVEFYRPNFAAAGGIYEMLVSTEGGAVAMPTLQDKGVIAHDKMISVVNGVLYEPRAHSSLPPVIIASPELSLYVKNSTDDVNFRSVDFLARIHYTTTTLATNTYAELFQTWNRA